ncbi:MAG: hypothetical protein V8R75_15180 [Oscillospiraceae bacterium]
MNSDIIFAYQGDEFNTATFAGKPVKVLETRLESAKAPLNVDVLYGQDGNAGQFRVPSRPVCRRQHPLDGGRLYADRPGYAPGRNSGRCRSRQRGCPTWLEEINDTAWPVAFRPACTLMEHSAARHPDRLAITTAEEKLTYSQLNAKANRLAHGSLKPVYRPAASLL